MSVGDPPVTKDQLDTHLAAAAVNLRQVFQDPGSPHAAVAAYMSNHDQAALVALGYTTDEAYQASLFGNLISGLIAYYAQGTAVPAAAATLHDLCRDLAPLR